MSSSTGFVFHELCLWHNTGNAAGFFEPNLTVEPDSHAESPATKRRIRNLLDVSGLLDQLKIIKPQPATETQILRFHTRQYLEAIKRMSAERGGDAGELTPFGTGSFEIACLAVGGTIAAIDAVLAGNVRNAYALVRPCGHHAEANRGRGFCIFGNVAIGVMHARAERGVGRVAIVDWVVSQTPFRASDILSISAGLIWRSVRSCPAGHFDPEIIR
jgi:acetoin utilization deacetylase AcuC-like enzyme